MTQTDAAQCLEYNRRRMQFPLLSTLDTQVPFLKIVMRFSPNVPDFQTKCQ